MESRQVADRLVALCRAGKFVEAIEELYADDVRQHENGGEPIVGRGQLVKACQGWLDSRIVHSTEFLGTHVAGNTAVLEMKYDVTPHASGKRHQWCEAAIYRVADGKITDVRFYYKPPAD